MLFRLTTLRERLTREINCGAERTAWNLIAVWNLHLSLCFACRGARRLPDRNDWPVSGACRTRAQSTQAGDVWLERRISRLTLPHLRIYRKRRVMQAQQVSPARKSVMGLESRGVAGLAWGFGQAINRVRTSVCDSFRGWADDLWDDGRLGRRGLISHRLNEIVKEV